MPDVLEASAKIDRRFARRFPQRQCWLRPATPAERKQLFAASLEGLQPCMAIWRTGADYMCFPFLSTSSDVADAYEGAAAETVVKAAQALREGGIARIIAARSGRLIR
ncbi:hypothetical protein [Paracoccus jeotgali]|uniref:hypothetical protein n=1 Tax=Paracoccus jeotgali TaxID=2065379 RepID=UPI00131524EB|nr:hypothetical protein [Paracoccus jeotgali]